MAPSRTTRRQFLQQSAAGAAAAAGVFALGRARAQGKGRVIILGFDGIEPTILEEMMARGEVPAFARLREQGAFRRLGSTIPPQSPTAWTSFSTCTNPGGHNIYDFIRRNPRGPRGPIPLVGTGDFTHPQLGPEGAVLTPPVATTYRKGTPFWSAADAAGLRTTVLNVPFAFPPEPLKNGRMLCALGVPDLRGTTSTFFELSDSFTPDQLTENLSGGQRLALSFSGGDTAKLAVPGPRDTREKFGTPGAFTTAEFTIQVDRASGTGRVQSNAGEVDLALGQWSAWLPVEFRMGPGYVVHALTRFMPYTLGAQVRLYMSPLQFHPAKPYVPFGAPDDYTATLMERYGPYKTIGWAYDTHAFRQNVLEAEAFLADIRATMAWRERLTLDELARDESDLLISVWTATDRVGHMFWRYRDEKHPLYDPAMAEKYGRALEETYIIADGIVGRVMAQLRENDLLMVLSDHGFESWRSGFNVNDWLLQEGYLSVSDPKVAERGLLQGIDWSKTRAYSVGLSSLYLNLQGRETGGIVAPAEAEALIAELQTRLRGVKSPDGGQLIFSNIYTRADYRGPALDEAPDIAFGYDNFFQSSKAAAKGAIAGRLTEPNDDPWSGEHAASDLARLPGILFTNVAMDAGNPNIKDLGVTALRRLGASPPAEYEGESLLG